MAIKEENNKSAAKGGANYFNKMYANEDKWEIVEDSKYDSAVRYLLIETDNKNPLTHNIIVINLV